MNEQIKKLEVQCWEPKQYGPPWFNSKKFAKLIVQECAKRIDYRESRQGEHCDDLIKHFGVE